MMQERERSLAMASAISGNCRVRSLPRTEGYADATGAWAEF